MTGPRGSRGGGWEVGRGEVAISHEPPRQDLAMPSSRPPALPASPPAPPQSTPADDEPPPLDEALERAVNLSAWLIRTGRQPPAKANYIGSRKYNVDITEVARLVGTRGGRRAGKLRRQSAMTPEGSKKP